MSYTATDGPNDLCDLRHYHAPSLIDLFNLIGASLVPDLFLLSYLALQGVDMIAQTYMGQRVYSLAHTIAKCFAMESVLL